MITLIEGTKIALLNYTLLDVTICPAAYATMHGFSRSMLTYKVAWLGKLLPDVPAPGHGNYVSPAYVHAAPWS